MVSVRFRDSLGCSSVQIILMRSEFQNTRRSRYVSSLLQNFPPSARPAGYPCLYDVILKPVCFILIRVGRLPTSAVHPSSMDEMAGYFFSFLIFIR
jgi:hypothetical protein